MLLNFDNSLPLHVIGKGVSSVDFNHMLNQESVNPTVISISMEEVKSLPIGAQCVLGFLDVTARKQFLQDIDVDRYHWPSYIHPLALVSSHHLIGQGVWIYNWVSVFPEVSIGEFSVVSTFTNLPHGCQIGCNNFIGPGVLFGGSATTGDNVFIGIGSKICDNVSIAGETYFAMNSTITKSITEPGTYVNNRQTTLIK